ncbi:hypothetical protein QTN47_24400 [Danxiaibacter flavus]|uniref:Uncharacterized protein n=1 Tax=Danxiaibacter flavus TaxID=3049108 RepID=A0ABV3ZMC0_9BACT|nr:hypothetical protein QNM32_24405 [Chitinophagaceae bacterium DXS]
MGFKASMVIIQHSSMQMSDGELLKKLGFEDLTFSDDTTFEECMYPNDKSINLGYYNDCLIISDDYQLTTSLELSKTPDLLSDYEKVLTDLFPDSEILTVACHSTVNYHLYSLVKDGQKLRFKKVVNGEPIIEYGDRIEEEENVYVYSKIIDGQRMFRSTYKNDEIYDYTEDQMMEDFAFGVAKRHLGVMISTNEDEQLMFDTPFKKYVVDRVANKKKEAQSTPVATEQTKGSWLSRLFKRS